MKWWLVFVLIVGCIVGFRVYVATYPDAFTGRIRSGGSVVNIGRDCADETGECFLTVKDDQQRIYKVVYGGRYCHMVLPVELEAGDSVEFYGVIVEETVYQRTVDVCSLSDFFVKSV